MDNVAPTSNGNDFSVWYADVSSTEMMASYATDANTVLLGNNVLRGSDNLFTNIVNKPVSSDGSTGYNQSNIERVDFLYSASGISATNSTSIGVFDRGNAGSHDGFKIAIITGWDSVNNKPSAYASTVITATAAEYAAGNVDSTFSYYLFRTTNGDTLTPWAFDTENTSQGIGGIAFTLADFGIAPGTTVYGYSIMASDDTSNAANLLDWTNSTYYPTDSADAASVGDGNTGGLDLVAVNGVMFTKHAVPEPAVYGACLLGLSAAFVGVRSWRIRRHAPAGV
jgi:hypothetical protein